MSSLTGKSLNPVMNRRSVIASAAGLGAMSILAGCSSNGGDSGSASSDASFKIGTIGPLTGANASYGKSVTQGVELGCKDFSTKELPLASKAEDDQADGEKAVNAFNTLLDWGMQALVGPTTTGASVAVAAECGNDPKTFMITPSASSEDVTKGKDCVFQVCFTDPNQGVNAAKFLAQKYADEKFVLFYNSGDAYSSVSRIPLRHRPLSPSSRLLTRRPLRTTPHELYQPADQGQAGRRHHDLCADLLHAGVRPAQERQGHGLRRQDDGLRRHGRYPGR